MPSVLPCQRGLVPAWDRRSTGRSGIGDADLRTTSNIEPNQGTHKRGNMSNLHLASASIIATILASAFVTGCAVEPLADLADDDELVTTELTSSLSGTAPVSWVGVDLYTGGDDKRSDSHVWLRVHLYNGVTSSQEITPGATWPNWSSTGVQWVQTPIGTRNQDIRDITIDWQQGGGGWNGDNWNLQSLSIYAWDSSYGSNFKAAPGGNPLRRFTGAVTQYAWSWVQ
jgi:hypothetical protein